MSMYILVTRRVTAESGADLRPETPPPESASGPIGRGLVFGTILVSTQIYTDGLGHEPSHNNKTNSPNYAASNPVIIG
jgi:hypothetical protein